MAAQVAVGCRVKSGRAIAVVLAGPVASPRIVDRRVVMMSDPDVPETAQPFHAAAGTLEQDAAEILRRCTLVERITRRSVAELLCHCRAHACVVRRAALVVGSLTDPMTIRHPHMRAHGLEGQLFRSLLESAFEDYDIPSAFMLEREAFAKAARLLDQTESQLRRRVAALGENVEGPWRVEEKMAASAAWVLLN